MARRSWTSRQRAYRRSAESGYGTRHRPFTVALCRAYTCRMTTGIALGMSSEPDSLSHPPKSSPWISELLRRYNDSAVSRHCICKPCIPSRAHRNEEVSSPPARKGRSSAYRHFIISSSTACGYSARAHARRTRARRARLPGTCRAGTVPILHCYARTVEGDMKRKRGRVSTMNICH